MQMSNTIKSGGTWSKYAAKRWVKREKAPDDPMQVEEDIATISFTPSSSSKKGAPQVYPTKASGYKLLECVGKGTEGSVWRAVCIPLKTEVAVKIVDLEALPNAALDEIRQQLNVMQLCNRHPNIVDYHTSFVDHHYLWVVMAYLGGGSCHDIMKYGFPYGLDEPAIRVILKGILKALAFFHAHGRIHRDIKAGNILLSDKGHVQVADFGVSACLADHKQLRTTLCGTPCWMAPEVMLLAFPKDGADQRGYGCAVDIWSLGITALELAKGRPPFSEYPTSKVFSLIVQQAPPTLSTNDGLSSSHSSTTSSQQFPTSPSSMMSPNTRKKFSKNFQDMIACCLQKDPAKRPTAEKLLKHKFFSKKASRDHLVNTILSKLPPLGERVRICQGALLTKPPAPMVDALSSSKYEWEFPEERDGDEEEEKLLERRFYRSARSLQSMSSSTSFASASFLSSASSSYAYQDSWINADVGSVEFLNHIFQEYEQQ